jgi:methyl-accepting chemotaxis protein
LINDSTAKVSECHSLISRSGKTLEEIVNAATCASDIIVGITEALREQANGIDQVNKAIMQMDRTTQ